MGFIGMTPCPGKQDLEKDIETLAEQGADGVLSVMERGEMEELGVPLLGERIAARGLRWWHLPVPDGGVLARSRHRSWDAMRRRIAAFLLGGKNLVVQCRGGLGRTGTFAAALLVDLRLAGAEEAAARVRGARPHAIETRGQEEFLRTYTSLFPPLLRADGFDDDRVAACLLGGAMGDALGFPVEFLDLPRILEAHGAGGVTELVMGRSGVAPVSDDTQMTLFTLEALLSGLAAGGRPGRNELRAGFHLSYLDWYRTQRGGGPAEGTKSFLLARREMQGARAPGSTCLSALASGRCGTIEAPLNDSKGCGGVMRAAPVGLAKIFSPEEAFAAAADAAAVTHGHPSGYFSAAAMAMMVRLVLDGESIDGAARAAVGRLRPEKGGGETADALEAALRLAREPRTVTGETIARLGEGWVGEEALAMGVFAALRGRDFRDALRLSASHGGDSDSTAALTGQLLGARDGLAAVPAGWIEKTDVSGLILEMAPRLDRLNVLMAGI
jgi:ADP-ribosyl-[dinitrogen reductase] hydrolase